MGAKSGIEWTDASWNPSTGCDRISDGCDICYALRDAPRLKAAGIAAYQRDGGKRSGPGFAFGEHAVRLTIPKRWRKPRRIFVNSMSDLFHEQATAAFIAQVFRVMQDCPRHTFQLLTKRHRVMQHVLADPRGLAPFIRHRQTPLPNVWIGVSVESQKWADVRIPWLLETPAAVRWLSMEPLLGPVDLAPWIERLDWVVVGGESGPNWRPMDPAWARELRDQCAAAGVPFFFKQWAAYRPKPLGRELDGVEWSQFPEAVPA